MSPSSTTITPKCPLDTTVCAELRKYHGKDKAKQKMRQKNRGCTFPVRNGSYLQSWKLSLLTRSVF